MLKVLVKKQLLELNTFYFMDRKKGTRRGPLATAGFIALFIFVFAIVAFMFFGISSMLADTLLNTDYFADHQADWLFFALLGLMSIILGTFGSVFNTYASLYQAKDNEMLLSMPIRPGDILISRMIGVFIMSLLYSALVWIPAIIVYWMYVSPSLTGIIYPVVLTLFIALFVTVLTCILGWLVALVASRLKNRSIIVVIISLVFFAFYYYVCFNLNDLLGSLITHLDDIGLAIKTRIYPIYQLGLASTGETGSMIIFCLITIALFVLFCYLMSRSFIRVITMNKGQKKIAYKKSTATVSSVQNALLKRELKHYVSSPVYMLNTGLGIVFAIGILIFALFKQDTFTVYVDAICAELPFFEELIPALILGGIMMIISMNAISAPSVSLEGKTLWVIRSLPISTYEVLHAKTNLHVFLNVFPAIIWPIVLGMILDMPVLTILAMAGAACVYVWFTAELGLILNLKMPNLSWTSEGVPVKQSAPVFFMLFGGWLLSVLTVAAMYLLIGIVNGLVFMIIYVAVLGVSVYVMHRYIKTKGVEIFESL